MVLDHGKAFWKPKVTPTADADMGSVTAPSVENACPEEQGARGSHEMEAEAEDNEGRQEGEDDVDDPLKCKLGGEFLKWEIMEGGVVADQRAKDGWGDKCSKCTGHMKWYIRSIKQRRIVGIFCFLWTGILLRMVFWVGLMHHCLIM